MSQVLLLVGLVTTLVELLGCSNANCYKKQTPTYQWLNPVKVYFPFINREMVEYVVPLCMIQQLERLRYTWNDLECNLGSVAWEKQFGK